MRSGVKIMALLQVEVRLSNFDPVDCGPGCLVCREWETGVDTWEDMPTTEYTNPSYTGPWMYTEDKTDENPKQTGGDSKGPRQT